MKRSMSKSIFVILAILLLTMALAACSGGGEGAEPAETGDGLPAADREMIVGVVKANSNFDPYGAYGDEAYGHMQVYDTLVIKDENGAIAPSVASSWEVSADGLVYTLKLRDDVKFSDGSVFSAEDAKFNIDAGKASSFTQWAMGGVDKCEVVDNSTIAITLTDSDAGFLEKLTWIYLVGKASYEAAGDQYGKSAETVVGSGPYIVSEWKPAESVTFVSNENYFGGAPAIKKVTFKTMSDANAAVIALQTGELDLYINDVPNISISTLQGSDKVSVVSYPSYVLMDIIMNCETGLFADVKLREAVACGVDREKMLIIGTEGQGVVVDYPGGPDYIANPNISGIFPALDVEKATQLVSEAGAAGTAVVIRTMDTDPWPKLATALQDDLNKIGFVATVEQMDYNAYSQDVWGNANYEIAICRYWSGTKDMSEVMNLVRTGQGMNFSHYSNPEADVLIEQGNAAASVAERAGFYEQAIRAFTPGIPMIPLYYTYGSRAFSQDLAIDDGNVQYDRIYYYSWK